MADKIVQAVRLPATENQTQDVPGEAQKASPRFLVSEGGSRSFPLQFPIEYDGVEYREITVNRLRGKDFRKLQGLAAMPDEEVGLLALMTGAPLPVLENLDLDDFAEVMAIAKGFLPAKLMAAGATSAGGGESS